MTDEELLRQTAAGDVGAFSLLVRRSQGRVLGLCSRLLSHPQNAEDVAQDVFLQLYKSARTFRGDCGVSTWLYRIAVNRCRNFNRDNRKYRPWGESARALEIGIESEPAAAAPEGDDPGSAWPVNETRELVRRAIASLPEGQKAMLVLHKFEGRSYQEIAEIMDVSLASVASRLHRAKRSLERKLAPLFPAAGRGRKF